MQQNLVRFTLAQMKVQQSIPNESVKFSSINNHHI